MTRVILWMMAVSSIAGAAAAAQLDLGDLRGGAIVVAKDAIPSERYAAEEFQRLFRLCSGIDLMVSDEKAYQGRRVFIGPGDAGLGDEGLRIEIRNDGIAITGGRPRGALYGVYEFFERYLGVRFLTADHTHVPEAAGPLRVPCETHTYVPPFSFRWSYYRMNADNPAFAARLRVNTVTSDEKLGGATPQKLINHSFYRYLPVAKYGQEHPEYFALVDNERRLDVGGGGPEPCVTDPDVIRIMTEGVLEDIRANPSMRNISFSQNDNSAYCRCPRCEAINEREGTPMGANLLLVNAVADAVAAEFPDVKVGTLAYWYTRQRPKTIRPRDNVQIQLSSIECSTFYPLDKRGIQKNQSFVTDMQQWAEVCDDIWIWNYNTNFSAYDLPFPNLRAIGPNVRFFHRNNVKGVFMQANGNGHAGELCDLRNYVIARCLWDPSQDSWALATEFCQLHYGQAADILIDYLTLLHDNAEAKRIRTNCFGNARDFGITRDVARRIFDYFDRAMDAATDPAVRDRVEKASICAYRAMLEAGGELRYEDGYFRTVFPAGFDNLHERYATLCRKHGMDMAAEQETLDAYLARIGRQHAGYRCVRLENDVWRLTFVPENSGALVDMLHKPSGQNLLSAMDRHSLSEGNFEEWAEQGYQHRGPFEATIDGNAITLARSLEDGSTIERKVVLDTGGTVRCRTTITHRGPEAHTYQTKVHPEFYTGAAKKTKAIRAYIQDGDTWRRFNRDWNFYEGPDDAWLERARGGGYAFYNHQAEFGMQVTYSPDQYAAPRLWWHPEKAQLNLELITRAAELQPGDALTYDYTFAYLDKPPTRRR